MACPSAVHPVGADATRAGRGMLRVRRCGAVGGVAMQVWVRGIVAILLGVALAAPGQAQDTAGATARQLSRAVVEGIQIGSEKAIADGRADPRIAECVLALDPLILVPTYERLLASKFTAAEVATLDAHYGSPLGELDWRNAVQQLREQQGLEIRDPVTLTSGQQAAIDAFLATDLVKRLNTVGTEEDPESLKILQTDIEAVIARCL